MKQAIRSHKLIGVNLAGRVVSVLDRFILSPGSKTAMALLALSLLLTNGISQAQTVEEVLAKLGMDRSLGSTGAPVSIVEFSDFQCSFCKKFSASTLPQLKESYIKTGQARFAYRHFPVLGKFSQQAAQASECAGEQGKFWDYHDKLFVNQGRLVFTNSNLKQYAQDLKLNVGLFAQCVDSGKYQRKVEGETAVAASLGARGTPTFFVNSRLLVGAQPFEAFEHIIKQELGKSGSGLSVPSPKGRGSEPTKP